MAKKTGSVVCDFLIFFLFHTVFFFLHTSYIANDGWYVGFNDQFAMYSREVSGPSLLFFRALPEVPPCWRIYHNWDMSATTIKIRSVLVGSVVRCCFSFFCFTPYDLLFSTHIFYHQYWLVVYQIYRIELIYPTPGFVLQHSVWFSKNCRNAINPFLTVFVFGRFDFFFQNWTKKCRVGGQSGHCKQNYFLGLSFSHYLRNR